MSDINSTLDMAQNPNAGATAPYSPTFAKPAAPPPAVVKREAFIGFASDEASAATLHEAFSGHLPANSQIHIVGFRASLAILSAMTTPEIVLVDLTGEDQPINAMMELADVVEPGTVVIAIGVIQNVNFYRTITKGMGVKEYLAKPLDRASVERSFVPVICNHGQDVLSQRGGRMVTLCGARGGTGTSTIAANLAWFISTELHRHTILLDTELHTGTIALNFDLSASKGLGMALEAPERVDNLLIERLSQPAGDRLHVLAGLENFDSVVDYKHGSATLLTQALRARYNFVVIDAGTHLSPFARDMLFAAQQRVIVMDPSIVAVRNLEKLLTLPAGPAQSPRAMVVLNKAGTPGGLSQSYLEQSLGLRFDAVIPDLPQIVPKTTQLGTQAASLRGPFRNAITKLAASLGATVLAEAA